MKTSPYITLLGAIFCLSSISVYLLFTYLDPEKNPPIAYATMGIALGLFLTAASGLILTFLKKIYYRGVVPKSVLHASIRQGFFMSVFILSSLAFYKLGFLQIRTIGLLLFIFFLLELMIQSILEDSGDEG